MFIYEVKFTVRDITKTEYFTNSRLADSFIRGCIDDYKYKYNKTEIEVRDDFPPCDHYTAFQVDIIENEKGKLKISPNRKQYDSIMDTSFGVNLSNNNKTIKSCRGFQHAEDLAKKIINGTAPSFLLVATNEKGE